MKYPDLHRKSCWNPYPHGVGWGEKKYSAQSWMKCRDLHRESMFDNLYTHWYVNGCQFSKQQCPTSTQWSVGHVNITFLCSSGHFIQFLAERLGGNDTHLTYMGWRFGKDGFCPDLEISFNFKPNSFFFFFFVNWPLRTIHPHGWHW